VFAGSKVVVPCYPIWCCKHIKIHACPALSRSSLETEHAAANLSPVAVAWGELDRGLVDGEAGAVPGGGGGVAWGDGGDEGGQEVDGAVERVHDGPRHLPRQDREDVPGAERQLQPERPAPRQPRRDQHENEEADPLRARRGHHRDG